MLLLQVINLLASFLQLLLPEIRMTVSNLSQAIHFLVDNDFLDGVELKPGDAARQPVEVHPPQEERESALSSENAT